METEINQSFRYVQRVYAGLLYVFGGAGQHKLVHAGAIVRDRINVLQEDLQIIGVEYGVLAHAPQSLRS